jgi:hypothetical protein
LTTLV